MKKKFGQTLRQIKTKLYNKMTEAAEKKKL